MRKKFSIISGLITAALAAVMIGSSVTHAADIATTPAEKEENVEQTIKLHQVITEEATKTDTMASTKYQGVNGSKWSVYDVSIDMVQLDDKKGGMAESEARQKIQEELNQKKYDVSKYPKLLSGETKTIDGIDGVLDVPTMAAPHIYQALLFVNDKTPEYISQVDDFVLITPLADENGNLVKTMFVQPKSQNLPKPKKDLPQTGEKKNQKLMIAGVVILAVVLISGGGYLYASSKNKK